MTDAQQPDPMASMMSTLEQSIEHAENVMARIVSGKYTTDEWADDVEICTDISLVAAGGMINYLGSLMPGSGSETDAVITEVANEWSVTMSVLHSVTMRPITPVTIGFRQIGSGDDIVIAPNRVSFDPPVINTGVEEFTVTVEMAGLPYGIYEGEITTSDTAAVRITDLVMPTW